MADKPASKSGVRPSGITADLPEVPEKKTRRKRNIEGMTVLKIVIPNDQAQDFLNLSGKPGVTQSDIFMMQQLAFSRLTSEEKSELFSEVKSLQFKAVQF